jgi:DNA-binding protein H-NS
MHTSYLDLEEQAAKLLKQADELRLQERAAIVAELKATISKHGITADELGLNTRTKKHNASPAPAKYKGPNGELWSGGRGRKPAWVHEIQKAGQSIEEYAIRSH